MIIKIDDPRVAIAAGCFLPLSDRLDGSFAPLNERLGG
jgi:hypothetical protein